MRARLARLWHSARGTDRASTLPRFGWPQGTRAAVSLSWDDARSSQLDHGMSILERSGIRASFYLNPSGVEKRVEGWRKAVLRGHEMGNHTRHHPCTGNFAFSREHALENYTLEQMEEELRGCSTDIEGLTGARPQTFAYPCGQTFVGRGEHVQSYVPLVARQFLAGRAYGCGDHPNDPRFCDLAQLNARGLDGLSFARARKLVEHAVEQGSWLIFAGHDIGSGRREQTTDARELERLCRDLSSRRTLVWVDTVEAVANYIERVR